LTSPKTWPEGHVFLCINAGVSPIVPVIIRNLSPGVRNLVITAGNQPGLLKISPAMAKIVQISVMMMIYALHWFVCGKELRFARFLQNS